MRVGRPGFRLGFLALVVAGAALAAPGCRRAGAGEAVELVIWSAPTGVEEKGFLRLCRRFEAEHPGVVVRNVGALSEEKLIRAIVAKAPPDLAYLYGTSGLGPLAANQALLPLDSYFAHSGLKEADFLPGTIAQLHYQSRQYAMPTTRDSRAFYWNRARFREAGLKPDTPPKTLEETLALAKRLTHARPDGTLEQLGMFLPDEDPALLFALFGGGACNLATGQITANRPENITALRWLLALSDAQGGYQAVSAFKAGFGRDSSGQNPLATGKVAMRMDGEWAAMNLEKFAPDTDYAVGELPYPAARPELRNMAWEDGDIMVIPNGSRHPEQAWEFMRWLQQPAQQIEYAIAMNNLPTMTRLSEAPQLTQGSRSRRTLGYILRHIASNDRNAHYEPPLPTAQLYAAALTNAFDRVLLHETSPEQALAEVQARVEREMRRYQQP